MSYLFYIDQKNNLVLHREVVNICPSFRALSDKEILYLVLAYDYSSPYKQFPEHQRKRKAMFHAFDDNQPDLEDSDRMRDAIHDYMSLQYNPKLEVAKSYQKKIDKLLAQLDIDDSPTSIKKIDEAIDSLQKRIRSLEMEVTEQTINEGVVKGNMKLSYLEKVQANRKHFLSVTAKK